MTRATKTKIIRPTVMIDVETTMLKHGEKPRTLFWGAATQNNYYRFETSSALANWLDSLEPCRLLHHSGFDVIQLLLDGHDDLRILKSHNCKIICSSWRRHVMVNTHAIFPTSLASIFSAFGYQKTSLDELDKRNYDDCVIGLRCMMELDALFLELIGISPLDRGTIAGTAFSAAEKIAGKLPKDLRYLEAYRGGRVEVFDCEERLARKFDINSSYPFSFVDAPESAELLLCRVKSDDWHGPFYDCRNMDNLMFPVGSFETWIYRDTLDRYILPYCNPSVTILEKTTVDLTWLTRTIPLILNLFNLKAKSKANGSGGMEYVCKILLNAMYGRIGLKGESERARIMTYCPDGDNLTSYQLGWNTFLVFDKINREPRSNYPLAAWITDNARGRLFAGIKQTQALYVDTDSVFTTKGEPSPCGSLLGNWKAEGEKIFKANNVKDYYWDGKRKLKGGERSIQWTLKRFARGESVLEQERQISGNWKKRRRLPDNTTEPLTVTY